MVEAPWLLARPRLASAGAHQALVVDAAVRIEAGVLDRQHRVLHHRRDLGDRRQVAPLLAELAQQHAVGREHAQRQLGPVVRQVGDVRQVGIGDGQGDARPRSRPTRRRPGRRRPATARASRSRRFQVGRGGTGRGRRGGVRAHRGWAGARRHYKNRSGRPRSGLDEHHAANCTPIREMLPSLRRTRRARGFWQRIVGVEFGKSFGDKDVTASIQVEP
jgi:hypothetical protein